MQIDGFRFDLAATLGPTTARISTPLTSVNFVTARDGFTLAHLTTYKYKHNIGNGGRNRDGADDNRSFNFEVEGTTRSPRITADRGRAMRNLLGTLLLSAGVPMITAGDEHGRTQRGNNNAHCHDSEQTWVSWKHAEWQKELSAVTRRLLLLRRKNPALRPVRYAKSHARTPSASEMAWYSAAGLRMSTDDWNSTKTRCAQYLAASAPELEDFNRVLVVVHGAERELAAVLPRTRTSRVRAALVERRSPGRHDLHARRPLRRERPDQHAIPRH